MPTVWSSATIGRTRTKLFLPLLRVYPHLLPIPQASCQSNSNSSSDLPHGMVERTTSSSPGERYPCILFVWRIEIGGGHPSFNNSRAIPGAQRDFKGDRSGRLSPTLLFHAFATENAGKRNSSSRPGPLEVKPSATMFEVLIVFLQQHIKFATLSRLHTAPCKKS